MIEKQPPPTETFRCPTCGAKQAEDRTCRRCKCDLTLVVATRRQARRLHQQCLEALRGDDLPLAAQRAQARYNITPDETSRRLLAVVQLLQGNYRQALSLAGRKDEG